jgi:hypothetical protein
MSRLYALMASPEAVAEQFGAELVDGSASAEMVEGNFGLVVYEVDGRRKLRAMTWGFPRPSRAVPDGQVSYLNPNLQAPPTSYRPITDQSQTRSQS